MKKKSPSLNSSAGSEDSGLDLKPERVAELYEGKQAGGIYNPLKISPIIKCPSGGHNIPHILDVSGQTTTTNTPVKSTEQDLGIKNSSKRILLESQPKKYLNMTYLLRDFPVKVFPLRENARVFKTKQGELFSTKYAELLEVKDQNTYSLRMLKDYFLTTQAEPSQLYSFRWMSLGMMSNGRCLTLSIGYPKTGKGSLSSVLEEKIDEKYYLTKKSLDKFIRRGMGKISNGENYISGCLSESNQSGRAGWHGGTTLLYEGAIMSDKNKKWLEDGKKLSRNFPQGQRVYSDKGIASSICGDAGGLGGKTGLYKIKVAQALQQDGQLRTGSSWNTNKPQSARNIRRLTPKECERLQGFPDDWTEGVSDTQRYKTMGNAVSVPVIEAIGRAILRVA